MSKPKTQQTKTVTQKLRIRYKTSAKKPWKYVRIDVGVTGTIEIHDNSRYLKLKA